jgi:hypothetical protein
MRTLLLASLLPLGLLAQSKTLLENSRVRIISAVDVPHQKSALHKHDPNRVMIYLTNGDQDITPKARNLNTTTGKPATSPGASEGPCTPAKSSVPTTCASSKLR